MCWYSASAWESHVCKHTQDGLPIFPDDLAFAHLPLEAIPSTSGSTSEPLLAKVILERAKAAKKYLEEEVANLHFLNIILSKVQSNQAKNRKMSRSLGPTQVTSRSHPIHPPT